MQKYHIKKIILITLTIFFLISISSIASAAGLEITNTNYKVIGSKSDNTKQYYNIFVSMENQETVLYSNITVELMDEWDIPTRQYLDFQPLEKKTIIFEEFPLAGGVTHEITVNYYPSNSSLQSSENMGTTTFSITFDAGTTSDTPFITPIVIIVTIIVASLINKKRRVMEK
jgi:hypothetical protein